MHAPPDGLHLTRRACSILTQPNTYARGILFGKMKYELGDHSFVRCPELDLVADINFITKGWVSGTYNAIQGHILRESTGQVLYELSGLWSGEMFITDVKASFPPRAAGRGGHGKFSAELANTGGWQADGQQGKVL